MADLTFKRFQNWPPTGVTFMANGTTVDLSTASLVYGEMEAQVGATFMPTIVMASSIATAGYFKIDWRGTTVWTSMVDNWNIDFWVLWANGGLEPFPNDGVKTIQILDHMASGVV